MTKFKVFASLLAMGFVSLPALSLTSTSRPTQPSFLGMHAHEPRDSSPLVTFGAFRSWGTGTRWEQIEHVR